VSFHGYIDLFEVLYDNGKNKLLRKVSISGPQKASDPSVVQPVASRYTEYAIPAPQTIKKKSL
jgi:hypothetical protein